MGYAFISYSSKNLNPAETMKQLLGNHGIQTWMAPADIPPGSKYAEVINKAIKECACVILLLSDASQGSVWVAKEIERAINYRKQIIPIQLEDLVLNDEFEFYISTDQIVALPRLDENSAELEKILSAVGNLTGFQPVSQPDHGHSQKLPEVLNIGSTTDNIRRYTLSLAYNETSVMLDDASVENLKSIYRDFSAQNRRAPVQIDFDLPDFQVLSQILLRTGWGKYHMPDIVSKAADQEVRVNHRAFERVLKAATEYLLLDTTLDACAIRLSHRYTKQYGERNCYFVDEYGIVNDYWTVFLWIDVINQMLNELLLDQYNTYLNSRDLVSIDGYVNMGEGQWGFTSFIKRDQQDDNVFTELQYQYADYLTFSPDDLAEHIFASFYIELARLKIKNRTYYDALQKKYKNRFSLMNCRFGLH